jgi:hypothetical protein
MLVQLLSRNAWTAHPEARGGGNCVRVGLNIGAGPDPCFIVPHFIRVGGVDYSELWAVYAMAEPVERADAV